jgi:hypothetical protein
MSKKMNTNTIDPNWVTGFFDGEGCFSVSFSMNPTYRLNIEIRVSVSATQTAKRG